ncbi:MAG: hypothetical protein K0S65_4981, partial [Labilithrix sp.]|nr:hypothetical protein [Labilithrix sp.]
EGSSNGCEFYLQPPLLLATILFSQSCYATYVVNTSTVPVDLALEYEGRALDLSKSMYRTAPGETTLTPHTGSISPGDGVVLFVSDRPNRPYRPATEDTGYIGCPTGTTAALYYDYYPKGTQFGSSFHLRANAPVSAAAIYPFGGAASVSPSATLLLPVSTWSKENILINAWAAGRAFPPGVQIVASEDDTDVTIVPTNDIQDGIGVVGSPAGVPATYRLQKGQFLQLIQQQELTGSFVTSTKPTSTFGAHVCLDVPSDVGTCDISATQIPAFEQWGSEYVGVGYRPRLGNEHEPMPYRIVAARDGTRLDYDPVVPRGAPLELNAGEMATFASGVGDAFVVRTQDAEHPIYLAQYMSGQAGDYWGSGRDFAGIGDPEFVNVVAAGQYLTAASFFADPTYSETSLVVVRAKTDGEFKDVILDCLGGPVPEFRPVGTRGDYEFARVDLSKRARPGVKSCYYGAHRLRSDGAFAATLWGWDSTASYAYPSGMATRRLVKAPLLTK